MPAHATKVERPHGSEAGICSSAAAPSDGTFLLAAGNGVSKHTDARRMGRVRKAPEKYREKTVRF